MIGHFHGRNNHYESRLFVFSEIDIRVVQIAVSIVSLPFAFSCRGGRDRVVGVYFQADF